MSGFGFRGLGDDSTDFFNPIVQALAPLDTSNLVTDPTQLMTGPSFVPSASDVESTIGQYLVDNGLIAPGQCLGCPPPSGGAPASNPPALSQAQLASIIQQWSTTTGKILQQVTLPSGQIQITGPNGQSEIIQTNANTAGISIPGLPSSFTGNGSSWLLIGGILFAVLAVGWGHK